MIRAILFDLDGTLHNRNASLGKFIRSQHERLYRLLGHIPLKTYQDRFIELDRRGYVWKDKVYQQIVEEFKVHNISWEQLLEDYLFYFKESCAPFPNLINMLDGLKKKGYSLGMITNGKGQFQEDTIAALGIEAYFDTILISEREGLKKPDVRIFEKALKAMNVTADESIYIGDHPENDVKAASHAGMKAIWKRDPCFGTVEADAIIEDLSEIEPAVERLDTK